MQPHDGRPGSSALGPLTRPGRDLVVLMFLMAGLIGLVRWRSGVEYPVPVSIGNMTIQNAAEVLAAEIQPIDDVRSTAEYRRAVAARVLHRLLRDEGGW